MSLKVYSEIYISQIAGAIRSNELSVFPSHVKSYNDRPETPVAARGETTTQLVDQLQLSYGNYRVLGSIFNGWDSFTASSSRISVIINDGTPIYSEEVIGRATSKMISLPFNITSTSADVKIYLNFSNNATASGGTVLLQYGVLEKLEYSTYKVTEMAPTINRMTSNFVKDYIEGNILDVYISKYNFTPTSGAFGGISTLNTVYMPFCDYTGWRAFANCENLETAIFPYTSCIGTYCFESCYNLKSIYVDSSICKEIADGGFNKCYNLSIVNFPGVTSLGNRAFGQCSALSSLNLPLCKSLSTYCFEGCINLESISINSSVSIIYDYCFNSCSKLKNINGNNNLINVTSVGIRAFRGCSELSSISLPACISIYGGGFSDCSMLSSVSIPVCQSLGNFVFTGTQISELYAPSCTFLASSAFQSCYNLSLISLPIFSGTIYPSTFRSCYKLLSLYLTGSSVCVLSNSNAFLSTPISTYTASTGGVRGSIYVPASLLSSYKSATNWITFSGRFVGI